MHDSSAIDTIKKSFDIMVDDPSIVFLYVFPAIIGLFMTFHINAITEDAMSWDFMDPSGMDAFTNMFLIFFIYIIISVVVSIIIDASVTLKVGALENNTSMGLGESLSRGMRYFIPLIISQIIVGLIVGSGFFLFIIPGIYLGVRLALFVPACVLGTEDIGCIRRSWELTRGRVWKILAIIVLVTILSMLIGLIIPDVGSSIAIVIFGPIETISMTLIYLEAIKIELGEENLTQLEG